jgi:hypothetical protein
MSPACLKTCVWRLYGSWNRRVKKEIPVKQVKALECVVCRVSSSVRVLQPGRAAIENETQLPTATAYRPALKACSIEVCFLPCSFDVALALLRDQ